MSAPASEHGPGLDAAAPTARSERFATLRRMIRDPLSVLGLTLVVLLFIGALFAEYITPYSPTAIDVKARLAGPALESRPPCPGQPHDLPVVTSDRRRGRASSCCSAHAWWRARTTRLRSPTVPRAT